MKKHAMTTLLGMKGPIQAQELGRLGGQSRRISRHKLNIGLSRRGFDEAPSGIRKKETAAWNPVWESRAGKVAGCRVSRDKDGADGKADSYLQRRIIGGRKARISAVFI